MEGFPMERSVITKFPRGPMNSEPIKRPKVLLVKTRGRSTDTLEQRILSEQQGEGPRGTLFERSLGCDVIDEGTIEAIGGFRGWMYARLPSFVAQANEARRRSGEYDAVITWSERHTIGVAAVFAMWRVPTPHIALMFWLSKPAVRVPLRLFRSGVDRIVTWSSVQRKVAINDIGFHPDSITQVKHPVDLEFFKPIDENKQIVFSAGSTQRDFPTLIQATEGLNVSVRIAASLVVQLKGLKVETTDVRSTLQSAQNLVVESMGSVKLRQSYAQAIVVVVPLLPSDIDAGVNVILEGMAMARPVVASRTVGQVDVITDGQNGILVSPENPDELREAIKLLMANPAKAEEMGRRARDYVEKNHRLEEFIENVSIAVLKTMDESPGNRCMWYSIFLNQRTRIKSEA